MLIRLTLRENPFKGKGKWGYIDRTGGFVIKPQYVSAGSFSHGLASVSVGGKYGYIDRAGKMVIKPQYDHAGRFKEGLAIVRLGGKKNLERVRAGLPKVWVGGKSGYIDTSGRLVVAAKYYWAEPFCEGLAVVGVRVSEKPGDYRGRYGFINKKGEDVIPLKYTLAKSFSDGLAAVTKRKADSVRYLWGYIDKKGEYAFKPHFDSIGRPFRHGLARDERGVMRISHTVPCLINKKGEVVVWGYGTDEHPKGKVVQGKGRPENAPLE